MREKVDQILSYILAALMAFMTIDVLWQVFSRYILRSPSSFTDELARYLLIWIGILGAAYVAGQGKHLAIDLLPGKLSPKGQSRLTALISLVIWLFAFVVMVIGGIRLVYITLYLGQTSSALQVPLGYVYLVLPISGLLVMFYKTLTIIESLKKA